MWWNEALAVWCAMTRALPKIVDLDENPTSSPQSVGTWWEDPFDNRWRVQLDDTHYAAMSGALAEAERNALTWMLATAHDAQKSPPLSLPDRLHELSMHESHVLAALMGSDAKGIVSLTAPVDPASHPGFLVWVQFDHQPTDPEASGSVRSAVDDVLNEWPPIIWRCWTDAIDQRLSLLMFVDSSQLDDLPDDDAPPNGLRFSPSRIRALAENLIDLVEQDAMRPCTAAISCPIAEPARLEAALASLLLADRTRTALLRRQRAVQFGEFPLVHLIQALPDSAHALLNQWSLDPSLSVDTKDTLRAMIQTNLNVSEAARLLYMHRNTLLNRIERIRTETTYDIRTLSGAATLWIIYLMHHT